MPRFSKNAKNVFDIIWHEADIEKAVNEVNKLKDPIDIAFAKFWMAFFYFSFYKVDLGLLALEDAEKNAKISGDNFTQFFINSIYFSYYAGFNSPLVNRELAQNYFNKMIKFHALFDPIDDWEKNFAEGWFILIKSIHKIKFNNEIDEAIKILGDARKNWNLLPENDSYLYKMLLGNNMGFYNRLAGNFDEAEKILKNTLSNIEDHNNLWLNLPFVNLLWLNLQKGNISEATIWSERSLNHSKHFNDTMGIFINLTFQADFSLYVENFDKSSELYQESLVFRQKHGDILQICKGLLTCLNFT